MLLLTDDALWANALARAYQQHIHIDQKHGTPDSEHQTWLSESGSAANLLYVVEVETSPVGVKVWCDCEGHQHGLPCKHAALVLERIGFLTRPAPPADDNPALTSLNRRMTIALLNGDDDEYDRLAAEMKQLATV